MVIFGHFFLFVFIFFLSQRAAAGELSDTAQSSPSCLGERNNESNTVAVAVVEKPVKLELSATNLSAPTKTRAEFPHSRETVAQVLAVAVAAAAAATRLMLTVICSCSAQMIPFCSLSEELFSICSPAT